MGRAWRLAIAVALVVGSLFVAGPAVAGGSTFSFTWRYVAPGQEIHGRANFSAQASSETGSVTGGPYRIYLLRGDSFIEPPVIPERAILLGTITLRPGEGNLWRATTTFTVPDVKPGLYAVSLCDDPCRHQYVGDLMGSWVHVVATPEEARLRNLIAESERRVDDRWSEVMSGLQAQIDALRVELSAADATSRRGVTALSDRLDLLAQESQRVPASSSSDGGGQAGLWLAGWLVAAAIGSAWWLSARRRKAPTLEIGESPAGDTLWRSGDEPTEELVRSR